MTDSPPISISADDADRKELLWTHSEQSYVHGVAVRCKAESGRHTAMGKRRKIAYQVIGIPSTVLPIISLLWQQNQCETPFVGTLLVVVGGSCAAVSAFLNLGQKAQQHSEYASRYGELSDEIENMLCKPKAGRVAADVFLERCQNRFTALSLSAP